MINYFHYLKNYALIVYNIEDIHYIFNLEENNDINIYNAYIS